MIVTCDAGSNSTREKKADRCGPFSRGSQNAFPLGIQTEACGTGGSRPGKRLGAGRRFQTEEQHTQEKNPRQAHGGHFLRNWKDWV